MVKNNIIREHLQDQRCTMHWNKSNKTVFEAFTENIVKFIQNKTSMERDNMTTS